MPSQNTISSLEKMILWLPLNESDFFRQCSAIVKGAEMLPLGTWKSGEKTWSSRPGDIRNEPLNPLGMELKLDLLLLEPNIFNVVANVCQAFTS